MDAFAELELMAQNASFTSQDDEHTGISEEDVNRWSKLFLCTTTEAYKMIDEHRLNICRSRVSEEHWDLVRDAKEPEGYNRETYEYVMDARIKLPSTNVPTATNDADGMMYGVVLSTPIATSEDIQRIAKLPSPPREFVGVDGDGQEVRMCCIDAFAKTALLTWLAEKGTRNTPTFVPISTARKDLSPDSAHPTLGLDPTMPQHRSNSPATTFKPTQNQYPAWYFFYGTLSSVSKLASLFGLSNTDAQPSLQEASIKAGRLRSWQRKYRALTNGPPDATVSGKAYLVSSKEQEEALCAYETANYEVVRCGIWLADGRRVKGCTFRFIDGSRLDAL